MTDNERKEYMEAFGKRVKAYREALGMTQGELAVKAGYTDGANPAATVSKIERGLMDITQSKCYDIAKALEIEPYQLFTTESVGRLVKYAELITEEGKNVDK